MAPLSVSILLLAFLSTLDTTSSTAIHPVSKDVCILGAGASGMASAVYLKDKGYDVIVLENSNRIAGHCNTEEISAPPQAPNWLDIGVQYFPDTAKFNSLNPNVTFAIDTAKFVKRFAGADALEYIDFTALGEVPYLMNVQNKTFLGPVPSPNQEQYQLYVEALQNYYAEISKYPWLSIPLYPDPIPQELLIPFTDFIASKSLWALLPFFNQFLQAAGMGSFQNLTTLYALTWLSPVTMQIVSTPNSSFSVKGGCNKIYEKIQEELGEANVRLNITITNTIYNSPPTAQKPWNIKLSGHNTYLQNDVAFTCKKLIVAFPQVASDMSFLSLSQTQRRIFRQVRTRLYFDGVLDFQGPLYDNASKFSFTNENNNDPYLTASHPTVTNFARWYPYGPAAVWGFADVPISNQAMAALIQEQIADTIPPSLITSVDVSTLFTHIYQPYVSVPSLMASPNFYTKLKNIQGMRNTYYVGALPSFAASYSVWDHAYRLINAKFPKKV